MAGNFQGRKLLWIGKKITFRGENFCGMLNQSYMACPKFRGENVHGWLSNHEIHKRFLPQKFSAIWYIRLNSSLTKLMQLLIVILSAKTKCHNKYMKLPNSIQKELQQLEPDRRTLNFILKYTIITCLCVQYID